MQTSYSVWNVILTMALLSVGVGCGAYGAIVPDSGPVSVKPFLLAFSIGAISLVAFELASFIYSEQTLTDRRKELGDVKLVDACPDFWNQTVDCNGKVVCIPSFTQTEDGTCQVTFEGSQLGLAGVLSAESGVSACAAKTYPWMDLAQRCEAKNRVV